MPNPRRALGLEVYRAPESAEGERNRPAAEGEVPRIRDEKVRPRRWARLPVAGPDTWGSGRRARRSLRGCVRGVCRLVHALLPAATSELGHLLPRRLRPWWWKSKKCATCWSPKTITAERGDSCLPTKRVSKVPTFWWHSAGASAHSPSTCRTPAEDATLKAQQCQMPWSLRCSREG